MNVVGIDISDTDPEEAAFLKDMGDLDVSSAISETDSEEMRILNL